MKDLLRLTDYTAEDIRNIFNLADKLRQGKHAEALRGKTVILFFPSSSLRTRVTFEKGIHMLGGQSILFPPETLDKKEDLQDVCGYLQNWADMLIVRHKSMALLEKLAKYFPGPVINAMTDDNHPCEILTDLYALSRRRKDFLQDKYLFCGKRGNIGNTWREASDVLGFELSQCCAKGYEMDGVKVYYDIDTAVWGKDIICTDSLPEAVLPDFQYCQVTKAAMERANKGALLNPCPPFYRDEELSEDAMEYFVGYEFKKHLLWVQQAIMIYLMRKLYS